MATKEVATLGGGCYWCLEACYQNVRGVESCVSGFMGGQVPNPTYREVCNGTTGHAEVIQVTFDPNVVSFRQLLEIFFVIHDPTTLNRQGADVGTQYRSAIFFHSTEQERLAREVMAEFATAKVWPNPLVTELAPAAAFTTAPDYHQDYFRTNPDQPYCLAVVSPKVQKLRQKFAPLL
jgi:peptide-methionine (S)-S-oxide reductase